MTFDDVFSERRQREWDAREAERLAKEQQIQEERERRDRTPIEVGNGRVLKR